MSDEQKKESHPLLPGFIDDIYDEFVTNVELVRMKESYFKKNFLPLFANQNPPQGINTAKWIEVVGGLFCEATVVDDNTFEPLFNVPPLYDANVIDITAGGREEVSLFSIVTVAKQLNSIHPAQSQAYLNAQLSKRNYTPKIREKMMENIQRWRNIFDRYNIVITTANNDSSKSSVNNTQNDLDYDDGWGDEE